MNTYLNDSQVLAVQNQAFSLRAFELELEDQFTAGNIEYTAVERAAEAVEAAVRYAVSLGATYRDLPAI